MADTPFADAYPHISRWITTQIYVHLSKEHAKKAMEATSL